MTNHSETVQDNNIIEGPNHIEAHSLIEVHDMMTGDQLAQAAHTRLTELKALYLKHLGISILM